MEHISTELLAYLRSWHSSRVELKRSQHIEVTLTFDEFFSLFEKRQLVSLQKAIDADRLRYLQDAKNPYAYVATWKSYAARSTNVWSKETACVCSRMKSEKLSLPQPGDTLRPSHRQNIRKGLIGVEKTPEHCENISAGKKGRPIAKWSDERREARRQLRREQEVAKRAA